MQGKLGELTLTPEAMIAATSFCQTSTVSQESLPGPAMFLCVRVCLLDWVWMGDSVGDVQVCVGVGRVQVEQWEKTRECVVGCEICEKAVN